MLQLREGTPDPFKGSWALSYKVNDTKKSPQDGVTYLEANNMLLKFNNSEDNQKDWSLIYHKRRTDISSKNKKVKPDMNVLNRSQRLAKLGVTKIKRDNTGKGKKDTRTKETLIPTDKGWSAFKLKGAVVQKPKNTIALKTRPGQEQQMETLLPTDGGWSLFKANNTSSTTAKRNQNETNAAN